MTKVNWHKMKNIQKIHRFLYAVGAGPIIGKLILLLTTTGRKSGLKRVTPVQYEEIDGLIHIGSARGLKADWLRNIQADPRVEVRVKGRRWQGTAEIVTDPSSYADFLEVRLERRPYMIGLMMEKAHGLPRQPSRAQLESLAGEGAMVVIRPQQEG
ncbi:MAG: nitroreductase family deazaflavin-dependent oxidoreductase [Anaerolineales bacterium]|nr:nitroreductase family deazaflavin-dependent oxidoreductase [Anaerolineales bacterium]